MLTLQLIHTYYLVCDCYNRQDSLKYQRQSNNNCPLFTDSEALTIYVFGVLQGRLSNRSTYDYIVNHWSCWFPDLPSYQAYNARINSLHWHFEVLIDYLMPQMDFSDCYDDVSLVDSLPIMLSKHPDNAKVSPDLATKGYCDSKKQYYHGVKFHCLGKDRFEKIPKPAIMHITPANIHDLTAMKPVFTQLYNQNIIGDKAYISKKVNEELKQNNTQILTPIKLKKGQKHLEPIDKLYSQYISAVRQPIEAFFKWLIDKTDIQNAAKVRSENALKLHCWGKVATALIIFIFNP